MNADEVILSYTVDYTMQAIYAIVGTVNEDGAPTSNRISQLGREGYNLLMEANPSWAPDKPANTFRKEDLITVIGILEASDD